jgi:endonuclease/exonuclease/phosphatase family metal-dependent hydrolase
MSNALKNKAVSRQFRVATYNVHKCRGMDGRVRPERIAEVLRAINADIVALQEVVCIDGLSREQHQARFLAEELGYFAELGENRRHRGGAYGNILLSRFPFQHTYNYDISERHRERRGCLRVDIRLRNSVLLHVFNIHLGTSYFERRRQAQKLFAQEIVHGEHLPGVRIVVGDFNEWTKGLATRLLGSHFLNADIRRHLGRRGTYPGVLPLLHLDHIYFDAALKLEKLELHQTPAAFLASDHLPLVADFRLDTKTTHTEPQFLTAAPQTVITSQNVPTIAIADNSGR